MKVRWGAGARWWAHKVKVELSAGELSKVNGRAEGGVRGGVVLMQLMLARLVGSTPMYSRHLEAMARRGRP
jgi:hypothetical protein